MLRIAQRTPNGTEYVVRNEYTQTDATLHHSCHVVLFGKCEINRYDYR